MDDLDTTAKHPRVTPPASIPATPAPEAAVSMPSAVSNTPTVALPPPAAPPASAAAPADTPTAALPALPPQASAVADAPTAAWPAAPLTPALSVEPTASASLPTAALPAPPASPLVTPGWSATVAAQWRAARGRPRVFQTAAWLSVPLILSLVVLLVASMPALTRPLRPAGASAAMPTATVPSGTPTPLAAATDQATLDLNAAGIPAQTVLGTNVQTWQDVTPPGDPRAAAALALLHAWNAPLVRLHLGFRGTAPLELPEATPGQWDFSRLDTVISTLRANHIAFFLDVRTAPPWMFDSSGQLPDAQFPAFATYMARLVSWYNQGGFIDDQGVFHASGHYGWIHTWEIWNEPKSAADIPVPIANRNAIAIWMAPDRFANLYDQTVTAMRAVDPTIVTGGPALGSWPDANNFYLQAFVQDETAPLDFLSFHFYAATSPQETDAQTLAQVTGPRFLDRLTANRQLLDQLRPNQHIPIWITELGIDEVSFLPMDPRGNDPIGYAFIADSFATAEANGVGVLDQFSMVSDAQYGVINIQTNQRFPVSWLYQQLSQQFPPGATLLPVALAGARGVVALAALAPDGQSLRLLLGDLQPASPTDVDGHGVPMTIRVTIAPGAHHLAGAAAIGWRFDATTLGLGAMPPAQSVPVVALPSGQVAVQMSLAGYGAAIITIPLA